MQTSRLPGAIPDLDALSNILHSFQHQQLRFSTGTKVLSGFSTILSTPPRSILITGKTMRRLLEIGWVILDEVQGRLHETDWAAVKEYDSGTYTS